MKNPAVKTTDIKINSYTLNKEKQLKKAITKLSQLSSIERKDGGGQYIIILCPPYISHRHIQNDSKR